MNIRDLRYLVAVAETRHFGKAAEMCHVTQPTLSMQLKKLEDDLGSPLFERGTRQVMITPLGTQIVKLALRILQQVDEMKSLAKLEGDPQGGDVSLGIIPTLAAYVLPELWSCLGLQFPRLNTQIYERQTSFLLQMLQDGQLDLAILVQSVSDEGLEEDFILREPFLLAAPQGHPLLQVPKLTVNHLRGHKLLLLEEGHCLRQQALEVCALAGAQEQQNFRATSLETLRQMVGNNAGLTLIPALASTIQHPNVVYKKFADPAPHRDMALVWRKTHPRVDLFRAMAVQIREWLATVGD